MQKDPEKNITNLQGEQAIQKLQELVKKESICFFCTELTKKPIVTRPMSTQEVDEEGNIWFLSSLKSHKNSEIKNDEDVQLFYSNPGNMEFLSILGRATVTTDQAKIEELWTPIAKAWFEKGKEDKDVSVIRITPQEAYYWDTKSSKMVSMVKMLVATVTGNAPDDGVEGKLRI